MGYSGFDFVSPHEIFREHARLTAHANSGRRALDLGAWADITASEYINWQPAAWPMAQSRESARGPMFADGTFMHADGRARFLALTPRGPEHAPTQEFPLVLNTGRVRDHWHTMTRTAKSARLSAHIAEPFAELNTADALRFAVRDGSLATLRSSWGSMVVRVRTGADVPAGMVFAPIHWSRAYASDARVGVVTNPVVDPISGEPELKHTPVSIEHFAADWYGVMLTRKPQPPPQTRWWVRVTGEQFLRYELAGTNPAEWSLEARGLAGVPAGEADSVDWIEYSDPARRVYRAAWFVDDRLEGCLYAAPTRLSARARLARKNVRRSESRSGRARQPARGSRSGRVRCGSVGVFLFRRGVQSDRGLRSGAGLRSHAGGDWQAPQVRYELRFLRRRDPGDHLGGRARRVAEMGTFLIC